MAATASFGAWVQQRRNRLGLTRKALAQQVGCSPVTIKKIERDERRPSVQLAQLLARHLHIPNTDRDAFVRRARGEYVPHFDALVAKTAAGPDILPYEELPLAPSTPFVGRERELRALRAALTAARAGQGQILFVTGGAGRGKSTLVQAFSRQAQEDDPALVVVAGYCDAITGFGDPYLPFRQILTMLTGDVEGAAARSAITRQHARRLWTLMPVVLPLLVKHGPDLVDTLVPAQPLQERAATWAPADSALFAQLGTLSAAEGHRRLDQARVFGQYGAVLRAIATRRPLLLIIEDLHWIDGASSGLLFHLSRELGDSRILLVGTYRPEEITLGPASAAPAEKAQRPIVEVVRELKRQRGDIWLDLDLLAAGEGRLFVDAYVDTEPNKLDESFREELFRRTEGHALFTVELLRAMQRQGQLQQDEDGQWVEGKTVDWTRIPARIEGVIAARLERLEEDLQAILAVASVVGETFAAEVVARVQEIETPRLVQRLSRELDKQHRLVSARKMEALDGGRTRVSIYKFRHHLFQDYLYRRLDAVERAHLHAAVGQALEEHYAGETEQVAIQLARHFEEAGQGSKAIDYLVTAGEKAIRSFAYAEAATLFNKGLSLLASLPEGADRNRRELSLHIALGNALTVTNGFAATEVEAAFARAWELCDHVDEPLQRFTALFGLWTYHTTRAAHGRAHGMAEQLLHMARDLQDEHLRLQAHHASWTTCFQRGEFAAAREHVEQGLALYDPQRHHARAFRYAGHDPGVCGLAFATPTLFLLGYPDEALRRCHSALSLAQQLSHLVSQTQALKWLATVHQLRRQEEAVHEWAGEAIDLATSHGYPLFVGWATTLRGWALAAQGQEEVGIAQIRQGLATYTATGAVMDRPYILALLGEALGMNGQLASALETIGEALAVVHDTGERYFESELYRLRGELSLARGGPAAVAEADFQQAIAVSRRQEARSLELRATMSLARLWQSQGKQVEAQRRLAPIYGWFREGFDTPDLKLARALLDELANGVGVRTVGWPRSRGHS